MNSKPRNRDYQTDKHTIDGLTNKVGTTAFNILIENVSKCLRFD